tara:strand:+ start:1105 stop:1365 length:261 start_codon:yes stop_codon:yes gene_type:complete
MISELNIVDVIGRRVELEVEGDGRYMGVCPFHKNKGDISDPSHFVIQTPTMLVDRDKKTFRCLNCNEKGNAQDFLDKFDNLDIDSL